MSQKKKKMFSNQLITTFRSDQWQLAFALLGFAIFFILAVVFYCQYENWSVNDSVFFVIVTLATVGYGQPAPTDDNSRLFTIFVIIIGIFGIFVVISDVLHNNLAVIRNMICRSNAEAPTVGDLEVGDIYHNRRQLLWSLFIFALCIIIGASVVKSEENWTWTEAYYFIFQTSSTVGYGDIHIKESSTKSFLCAYIFVSTIIAGSAIKCYTATLKERKKVLLAEKRLQLIQSMDFLVDECRNGGMGKHEVVLRLLTYLGKLDHAKDVEPWLRKLSEIEGSERISQEQLLTFVAKEREDAQIQAATLQHLKSSTRPKLLVFMLYDWFCKPSGERRQSAGELLMVDMQLNSNEGDGKGKVGVKSPMQYASADEDV